MASGCDFGEVEDFECIECDSDETEDVEWSVVRERLFKKPKRSHPCCECGRLITGTHYAGFMVISWFCYGCKESHGHGRRSRTKWLHQCNECRDFARKWNAKLFGHCDIPYQGIESFVDQIEELELSEDEEKYRDELIADCDLFGVRCQTGGGHSKGWHTRYWPSTYSGKGLQLVDHRGNILKSVAENGLDGVAT